MNRSATVLLILFAATASSSFAQPCSSETHRQFDFWIGDWTVKSTSGAVVGENRVERILDGCVLQENWRGVDGSAGRSFNMFYELDGDWHQTWVDRNGSRLDLAGGLDRKGRMVLSGKTPANKDGQALHEISFTPSADGTVRQHWRASRDRGKTWSDLFVGVYERKR